MIVTTDWAHDAFAALAAIISAISVAMSTVAVARINSTKSEVQETKRRATDASSAAKAARDYAAPIGNGYAEESRATWRRIEDQLADLQQRHVKTNAWLIKHLTDHARHDVEHHGEHQDGAS